MGFADTFFGSPDQTMALGLLGAGLVRGDFGGGAREAMGLLAGAKQRAMQERLMEAQIAETLAQSEERKQNAAARAKRMDAINGWMSQLDNAVPQANQSVIGQTGNLAPTMANAGLQTRALGQLQADNPLFGIPRQAILGDLALNEGKNLSEWMFKRGTPDMQNINGVWIDKNRAQPGQSVPQMSPTGQGYQLIADASAPGGYRVTTPAGAMETYRGFKEADADIASRYALEKVYNPATQREEFVPRSRVLGQQPQQMPQPMPQQPQRQPAAQVQPQPGMVGNFVGDPAQVMEAISQMKDPQERANAMAAFQEQARRTRGFTEGGGFAAGPSANESAQAAERKAQAEAVGKDVAATRKSIMDAGLSASSKIGKLQQLGQLLSDVDGGKLTPLGTTIASAANSFGIKLDPKLANKEAAAALANEMALELRNPSGGAGMPGALSDKDREFLQSMTPSMAQSAKGRKMLIDARIALYQREQQMAEFARRYEDKYGRLDNGFFNQMQAWSNANNLFQGR